MCVADSQWISVKPQRYQRSHEVTLLCSFVIGNISE